MVSSGTIRTGGYPEGHSAAVAFACRHARPWPSLYSWHTYSCGDGASSTAGDPCPYLAKVIAAEFSGQGGMKLAISFPGPRDLIHEAEKKKDNEGGL